MTEASIIVLRLPGNRLALQRRNAETDNFPFRLGLFGGKLEPGETHLQAMQRELQEETSLQVGDLVMSFLMEYEIETKPQTRIRFYAYEAEIEHAQFDVFEGDGVEVFSEATVLARPDLTPGTRYILERIIREE